MIRIGVMGLGMMGVTHLDAYAKCKDGIVVAVSDKIPERLHGQQKAAGNVDGQAQGAFDLTKVRKYTEGMDLVNDPEVDVVDICLPTHLHVDYALATLEAGKHLLIEKPLARTYADARRLADAADKAKGITMTAMCLRFWPGWTHLKEAVDKKTYGNCLAVHFRRVASHPGGAFYSNGDLSGGAALDLHIHDTDFAHHLFGLPQSVYTAGYSRVTNQPDHLITHYRYESGPMVTAEGCWCMAAGFPFKMQFTANFERASLIYDFPSEQPLTLVADGKAEPVRLEAGMGYDFEIAYFLDCIKAGRRPDCVTMQQAADTIRIVEAEVRSGQSRQPELV